MEHAPFAAGDYVRLHADYLDIYRTPWWDGVTPLEIDALDQDDDGMWEADITLPHHPKDEDDADMMTIPCYALERVAVDGDDDELLGLPGETLVDDEPPRLMN